MCDFIEKIKNEGFEKGQGTLIRKMLDEKLVTQEQIADLLKIPVKDVKKIAKCR